MFTFQSTRYQLTKSTVTLCDLLDSVKAKLFRGKEPFLMHLLRKELGKTMRQNLRKNIRQDDLVIYSDFSKELELTNPETLKNEGFGASHRTYQIIPQVKII